MLLNVHSYYSLRYGTIPVGNLIDLLIGQGYRTAVLTDINNSTGILEFIQVSQLKGFNGLAGIEFRNGDQVLYIGIAKNNLGFHQLNEFLSHRNLEKRPFPERAPCLNDVFFIYPFGRIDHTLLGPSEFIGIRPEQVTRLFRQQTALAARLVIMAPVTMADKEDFRLHLQLRAIDHNTLLSRLQPSQAGSRGEVLRSLGSLLDAYRDHPGIIANTAKLLENCSFEFNFRTRKNKKTFTGSTAEDRLLLEKLANEGCLRRYGPSNSIAKERVQKELEVINTLGFCSYFLITWDITQYSTHRGFYHVGRGSGANSIVAYCLGITDVCPLELDLYFERFLNPKRRTAPDFDIDYSWDTRDQVFNYIFQKYGRTHTALLGTMSTFKDRSIIREIAKIYGLPKMDIDRLIEQPGSSRGDNAVVRKVLAVFNSLPGEFPNQRSIHAGGVLITEEPITSYCALDLPPKNYPTAQIDMYAAENIGIEKLDILSQRGIGHIREAVQLVADNRQGLKVDIHDICALKRDSRVADQLRSGNTIGCFYIESPSMRSVLKKLQCADYITLVAASSIIRPGVGSSGMMDTYIRRFRNPGSFSYLHQVLEDQLKETFGVMIYQEDVLKIGHHYGGLGLDDADVLRRLMSGKTRGKENLVNIQRRFFENAARKGYDPTITEEVWRQIKSFAGYSFSKAHSASYAVESYQSLYLKAYFPLEFAVAVINNAGGFYARWVYVAEARRAGGIVHLPCVMQSMKLTSIQGSDIYLGLNTVKGLETITIDAILKERREGGQFLSLENLLGRINIALEQVLLLINVGAFRSTGKDKKTLLWLAHLYIANARGWKKAFAGSEQLIVPVKKMTLPAFYSAPEEQFFDEMELIGFSVSLSPFQLLQTNFRGEVMARNLMQYVDKVVRMVGLLVTMKPTRTKKGDPMAFGTFLDVEGDFFDTVHFPQVLMQYPFKKSGIYLILGRVTLSFDFPSITVEKMAKLPIKPDPRFIEPPDG